MCLLRSTSIYPCQNINFGAVDFSESRSEEGDPTFAPATIATAMISLTTKSYSEGDDWVFGSVVGY